MIRKGMIVAPLCAALAACAAPAMVYTNGDGSAPNLDSFSMTRTICLGEMHKANMAGLVADTNDPIADGINAAMREREAEAVMAGCMAQHGYKLVPAAKETGR
jgi:hypothetical protein